MMVSRLKASLAYRLPRLYQRVLDLRKPALRPSRPSMDLTLLLFSGDEQRPLLRESLLSVCRSWRRLPRLTVVSDGTADPADVRNSLDWWPAPFDALDWRALSPLGDDPRSRAMRRFAEREPMGRKLTAIVAIARRGPVVYSDTDILWFRHPDWVEEGATTQDAYEPRKPTIRVSIDPVRSYDDRLVPERLPHLDKPPYLCAGLLYACGDLLASPELGPLLEFAADQGVARTEQTIIAEISQLLDGVPIPACEVATILDDATCLLPRRPSRHPTARHYVQTVRHLFWRDALLARHSAWSAPDPTEREPHTL